MCQREAKKDNSIRGLPVSPDVCDVMVHDSVTRSHAMHPSTTDGQTITSEIMPRRKPAHACLARRVEERIDAAEAALLRDGRRGRVPPVQPLLARAGQELLLGPREGLVLAPRGRRRLAPRRDRLGPGRVEGVEERVVVGRLCERRRRPGF